ncbi:MAG: hypothetical protein HKN01_00965 [Acidimicrobiia bacterium]|nr:hypothetical protein [Acidimicrobiia bacterium]
MPCLACGTWSGREPVCSRCAGSLRPAPDRRVAGGLLARAGYAHEGAARRLVHRLKYTGQTGVARLLAEAMAPLVPPAAEAVVPIPRSRIRHWRYGVDPAADLAAELGRICGIPVVDALRPALWWPRHAAAGRSQRRSPVFGVVTRSIDGRVVLVDDVVTTGATAMAAARLLSMCFPALVTATAAGTIETRSRPGSGEPGGEVAVTATRRATRSPVAHPVVERSPGASTRPWQEHARRRGSP